MKKIVYLFIASLALSTTSCDKDFEEINITPNSLQQISFNCQNKKILIKKKFKINLIKS